MSQFNAQKNPPWARSNEFAGIQHQPAIQQQMINPAVMQYPQQGVGSPQQTSVYQAQLAMQQQALSMQFVANNAQQMYNPTVSGLNQNNVSRNVNQIQMQIQSNPVMMQQQPQQQTTIIPQQSSQQTNNSNSGGPPSKQRVFTGTVTKILDTYGFVDEDVFFQMTCVKGAHPVLNDRVLVEAVCLPTMPFKWNATRVQVLPMNEGGVHSNSRKRTATDREERHFSSATLQNDNESRRDRERDSGRSDSVEERRRRRERREREEKEKDRDKDSRARSRTRSRSPRRSRNAAPVRKYRVRIPEFSLDMGQLTVNMVRSRYASLYIPSDFFLATARYTENVPLTRPLSLAGPSRFLIMDKEVDPVFPSDDVLEPPDADFLYSAKVMLLSIPSKEELLKRCVSLAEDGQSGRWTHPSRLIDCLVGVNTRGKNEYLAIGGPWSPSLDGEDVQNDPNVLIKTAIRTCRALTGIDLKAVTKWYRFAELRYHRAKTTYKSREVPARVETVVMYAADVWSVMPSALEWDGLHLNYQRALDSKLTELGIEVDNEAAATADDEKEGDGAVEVKEPTHWSKIDIKVIKVNELREELVARNMSPKGLRLQLIARLSKVLKQEQEIDDDKAKAQSEAELSYDNRKKSDEDKKAKDKEDKDKKGDERDWKDKEKERSSLVEKFKLPDAPHLIVHPCKKAKNGKFTCRVVCLSLLLDYSQENNKEHTFEVSLFAENFNEMLMRDFGLQIYNALTLAPEKVDEKKEKKDDDKERKDKPDDKDRKEKVDDKERDKKEVKDKNENKEVEKGDDEKKMDVDGDKDRDKTSVNGKDDDDDEKRRKKRNGKKRERIAMRTINPDLLLAFTYFDTTHYGKIAVNDLEELFQTLGLLLSRSQIKKLISKVTTEAYLDYSKLTDAPVKSDKPEGDADGTTAAEKALAETLLAGSSTLPNDLGNLHLLPKLNVVNTEIKEVMPSPAKRIRSESIDAKSDTIAEGMVLYRGSLLNIENLQELLKKNEVARLKAEDKSQELRRDLSEYKEKLEHAQTQLKEARKDLSSSQKTLDGTKDRLNQELISSDVYLTTLMDIQERITPILDTDELKRLTRMRQELLGAPKINLVPLSKLDEIKLEEEMEDIKVEKPIKKESKHEGK